jgi:hypothetical protein
MNSREYSNTLKTCGSKERVAKLSKTNAEGVKKYFCQIKFSTQVLKTLWKSRLARQLTSHSSTEFSGLHHFCATKKLPPRTA